MHFFLKAIIYSVNRTIPHERDSFLTRQIKLCSLAFFFKEPLILFTIEENIIIFHIQNFFPIRIISAEFEHKCIRLFSQDIQSSISDLFQDLIKYFRPMISHHGGLP